MFGCLSSFCFLRTPGTSRVPTEAREHAARQRDNFNAPRLWLKQRACAPQAGGRQAAGLAQARPKACAPRGRAPTDVRQAWRSTRCEKENTGPRRTRLRFSDFRPPAPPAYSCNFRRLPVSAFSRVSVFTEIFCHQEPVSDHERQVISRTALS